MQRHKSSSYTFISFYQFHPIADPAGTKTELYRLGNELGLLGLILLAEEGINGTVCGEEASVQSFSSFLRKLSGLENMRITTTQADLKRKPFRKLKIKIKPEIVTMGVDEVDAAKDRGIYVEPEDWNELISDPDVLLIDTRNVYEYRIGSFQGATDPRTLNFRHFPAAIEQLVKDKNPKKVAMFCTGGIRCEKASAYTKSLGVEQVYHLKGGILNYLQSVPQEESSWLGKCFVFDGRITVEHSLEASPEPLCKVCGQVMIRDERTEEYGCIQCKEYPPEQRVKKE